MRLPAICVAVFVTAPLWASATYTFTAPNNTSTANFTSCTAGLTCANFTAGMSVSGSFTLASPLAANLSSVNIPASQVTSYIFTDGINTYSNTDPNGRIYLLTVSTDASGNITTPEFVVQKWLSGSSPHVAGDAIAYINENAPPNSPQTLAVDNGSCAAVVVGPSGVADTCQSVNVTSATSSGTAPLGTFQSPGTNVPTLGEWGTIALVLLLIAFGVSRLRRQQHPAPVA